MLSDEERKQKRRLTHQNTAQVFKKANGNSEDKKIEKKGKRKHWCVLISFFNPRFFIFIDKSLSKKDTSRWKKQSCSWKIARARSRALWSVWTIFLMSLSSPKNKKLNYSHFFQICWQYRTRNHTRKEETQLTFCLCVSKTKAKWRFTAESRLYKSRS